MLFVCLQQYAAWCGREYELKETNATRLGCPQWLPSSNLNVDMKWKPSIDSHLGWQENQLWYHCNIPNWYNRKANPELCIHANMCPRKIWRCYKIGEINACTYPYIAQINKLLLEPGWCACFVSDHSDMVWWWNPLAGWIINLPE